VAYVASLGDGPELPDVDVEGADLANGGLIYRANCQACHSASGSGGALSYGRAAPGLADATPTQVGAAVRIGPGQMPVFGPDIISDEELDDLAAYVEYLKDPEDPGGVPIGRTGPIPEGFVAWLVGMTALLALVAWIGTRSPIRPRRRPERVPARHE
jgi:ubiquinol-cytochrome c reductase cytochrome c subunit